MNRIRNLEDIWEDWSDEEDGEDMHLVRERRQYKMHERINMEKWDDQDFHQRFRLRKDTVAHILQIILPALLYDEERPRYITPITQLLICLRFYALGSMQIAVADFAGVCSASVCRILRKVSEALARQRPNFLKMPETHEAMMEASRNFYSIARFPRTIGSIDCTHIKIQSFGGDRAENYRNRKGWFSLNVQTVSDAQLKIINIVARWPGSSHDQTIFNNSNIKMKFERGDFGSFILVGDSGYRNTSYLATPFLRLETEVQRLYNEGQIRTRNIVERSYGVLKRRFPVLALGMRLKLETVQTIIVACAVLHNIAIDARDPVPPTEIEGFEEMIVATEVSALDCEERNADGNVRQRLIADYFPSLLRLNN